MPAILPDDSREKITETITDLAEKSETALADDVCLQADGHD